MPDCKKKRVISCSRVSNANGKDLHLSCSSQWASPRGPLAGALPFCCFLGKAGCWFMVLSTNMANKLFLYCCLCVSFGVDFFTCRRIQAHSLFLKNLSRSHYFPGIFSWMDLLATKTKGTKSLHDLKHQSHRLQNQGQPTGPSIRRSAYPQRHEFKGLVYLGFPISPSVEFLFEKIWRMAGKSCLRKALFWHLPTSMTTKLIS